MSIRTLNNKKQKIKLLTELKKIKRSKVEKTNKFRSL